MNSIKLSQAIAKCMRKLRKNPGRISLELVQISNLIKLSKERMSDIGFIMAVERKPMEIVKKLMVVHKLLIENVTGERAIDILNSMKCKVTDVEDQIIHEKFVVPYKMYLQRRCLLGIDLQGILNDSQNSIDENRERLVYHLLNLLNRGTAFSDIIYTFGRYFSEKYRFTLDFNLLLGQDLLKIYNEMVLNVKRPASQSILEEIELVHEKMYIVYYNCYNHKNMKKFMPKWVYTDNSSLKRNGFDKTPSTIASTSKKHSELQTINKSQSNMYMSQLIETSYQNPRISMTVSHCKIDQTNKIYIRQFENLEDVKTQGCDDRQDRINDLLRDDLHQNFNKIDLERLNLERIELIKALLPLVDNEEQTINQSSDFEAGEN